MKSYLKLIGILTLPLAFILYYAYSPVQIPPPGWKLTKLQLPTTPQATENKDTSSSIETRETRETRTTSETRKAKKAHMAGPDQHLQTKTKKKHQYFWRLAW